MLPIQNSSLDGTGSLAQRVNRSPLGYSYSFLHLESSNVGDDTSTSGTTPSFTVPMLPPDGNIQMFDPIDPMASEYAAPAPIYTSHLLQFSGYHPTADSEFVADAYHPLVPTSQPLDNPADFGGVFYEPTAAQQLVPPAAPGESIPPDSFFNSHPCRWLGGPRCPGFAPSRNREMGEHLRVYHRFIGHERDAVRCEWGNCSQTVQRINLPRHVVSRHLFAAASCRFCGKRLSRLDVVVRHERACTGVLPAPRRAAARI